MLLLAYERGIENVRLVFADTGHEHPLTYGYIQYLDGWVREKWGVQIEIVRADFADRMEFKRRNLAKRWAKDGVPQERIDRALAALQPTGNPFLDLCKLKGRFPSTMARFCTQELKHLPIQQQVIEPAIRDCRALISWQGVRAEESPSRAKLPEKDLEFGCWEPEPEGFLIYRPLIQWTAEQVFDQHRKHGVDWNPLYEQGMGRVGCMPCIMARKSELREIAQRFPGQVDRLAGWEDEVSLTTKRGRTSFFATGKTTQGRDAREAGEDPTIGAREVFDWARTGHGGRQYDLLALIGEDEEMPSCSSQYGLCE